MHHSANRRRWFLVAGLLLPLGVFLATPGQAQPPGFPRPPHIPNIPEPPDFPRHNPGFGGPRMGIPEQVWTCSKCGAEIGRGPFKPHDANCASCGARFGNTTGGMMANSQDRMDDMQRRMQEDMNRNRPQIPNIPIAGSPVTPVGTPVNNPFTSPAVRASRSTRQIVVAVVIGLMAVGLLTGAGFAIYYFARKSSPAKARRISREDRPRSRTTRPGTRARDLFRE